jgi:beta-lactamase class A
MPSHELNSAAVALAAAFVLAASPGHSATPAPIDRLQADIAAIAKPGAGTAGRVGVAAWRLDGKGPVLLFNADEAFPMASTFKVAVAGAVLARVEKGETRLDKMITIEPDRMDPSEIIAARFIHPGVALSVYNLLELMLTQSDNTAADYMVDEAGGPEAVTAWVRAQGVRALRVDGGVDELFRRYYGLGPGPMMETLEAKAKVDPSIAALSGKPHRAFDVDPRDTASPRAMAELLTKIFNGRALNRESTRILTEMMARCRTGAHRLRGMMPPDAEIADKTGTIGGTVNDVGVITLPGDAGKVAVVVFIKASDASEEARAQTIAQIGRSVRDFYLYEAN